MRKLLKLLLFAAFLSMTIFGAAKLLSIQNEYAYSEKTYDAIADQYAVSVTVPEAPEASETDPTETAEPTEPPEYAPIQVDFESLLQECEDIIGWLYCEDTVINYPVTQCSNNDYYLNRLPNGKWSGGGTIFMDFRNQSDMSDWNSILYGHNMNDDSMFGTLCNYRWQDYADAHPVMYFLTPTQDYKIEIIGGYTTPSTSKAYVIPGDKEGRDDLVNKAVQYTEFKPKAVAGEEDRLITLSTCTYEYDEARFIIVGAMKKLAAIPEKEEEAPQSIYSGR